MHREPALLQALSSEQTGTATALRQRGLEAYAAGDLASARPLFEAALRADPLDADTLGDLAGFALHGGNPAEACRLARRALVVEPEHDPSTLALAMACAALGDSGRAIALLQQLTSGVRGAGLRARDPHLEQAAQAELARLHGRPLPRIEVLDPRTLSYKARFDVLAKYLYALQRRGRAPGWLHIDAAELYARHIHLRTGGAEPGDAQRKGTLGEFVQQFDALIDGMAAQGYDASQPIPLSADDGLPRNGAHRLAAALALGSDVAVTREPGPGGVWDHAWFVQHGFGAEERNQLLRAWASIKGDDAGLVVLWSAVEDAWADLEAAIDALLPVVAARTIELPRPGFDELVHDIYSSDWGPCTGPNIHAKVERLAAFSPRVRVLCVERPVGSDAAFMRQVKDELRNACADLAPVEHFVTLHLSESLAEAQHLFAIFLNENNLRRLRRRGPLAPDFLERLDAMWRLVRERGIDPADCCVVGASVLEALGIRRADDVDFTLRSALRFQHFDGGVTQLAPDVDVVSFNYPRSFSSAPALTDDRMIDDPSRHFLVRGVRFADPAIVLTRKQHQRREKDLRDVGLLGAWFEAEK